MKKGDKIKIMLHGHDECGEGCKHAAGEFAGCGGVPEIEGEVTQVLPDGFLRAIITDDAHPLALVDGAKRVLACGPGMYAPVAQERKAKK